MSPSGPIVWGDGVRYQTGVTPYVHPDGARTSSLRRLYKKWPYFTNGSARTLQEVLERFGYDASRAYHDGTPGSASRLTSVEQMQLRAFLVLL